MILQSGRATHGRPYDRRRLPCSPRHEGADAQLHFPPITTRANFKEARNHDREKGVERVEDPSQVQGSALAAGGPRKGAQP